MIYTLDTNVIAAVLRGQQQVMDELERCVSEGHEITLNAISYFETRRGLKLEAVRKRLLFEALLNEAEVLNLDRLALDISAGIYQTLRERGTPLEDADILIAGIALAHDATLVTRNLKHFERVEGLRLESWESAGEA